MLVVVMSGVLSERLENTVDAMRGMPLADRILARKNELEDALADVGPYDHADREAIEFALGALYYILPGDLAHPPPIVARALSQWLELYKYVGQDITRRQQAERMELLRQRGEEKEPCPNHACNEAA